MRCHGCRKTHAIIPSFSVPHTSLDTKMVQTYLKDRDSGASRMASSKASGFFSYASLDFLRSLEKRFAAAVVRGKALYPDWGNEHSHGYRWIVSATGNVDHALFILNERAINFAGQSFFGGNVLMGLRCSNSGIVISHKNDTTRIHISCLDSC